MDTEPVCWGITVHPRVSLPKGLSVSLMLGDEVILPKSHFFYQMPSPCWFHGGIVVRGLHKVVAAALLLASGLVGSPARKQRAPHSALLGASIPSRRLGGQESSLRKLQQRLKQHWSSQPRSGTREQPVFGGGHRWLSSSDCGEQQNGANGCACFFLFFWDWQERLHNWGLSIRLNLAHSCQGTDQSWPEALAVWKWKVVPCVVTLKAFFLWNQIWTLCWHRTPSLLTLPRPAGSRL